ncbi:TniQ family protein [Saccharospirillum mangrovi]|uniref:TniQ family protein n=1 Tax=Saccharospirillum mangrovi TaxID=2161747 RepID=UPI000D33E8DF|nr:TniQ family protein [Saccharospirillum mangrovi]
MILVRPSPYIDECIVGYLNRISEVNGFRHFGYLLQYAGLNWKNHRAPIHQLLSGERDIQSLFSNLGLQNYKSKASTAFQSFRRAIDTPYFFVKYPRVCPECLSELGYCRFQWALLPVVACPNHKKMLVDINLTTGERLSWYRQHICKFDDGTIIRTAGGLAPSNSIQQSRHIEMLLFDKRPSNTKPLITQGLGLRELLSLIHFIAHFQVRILGGSFKPASLQCHELGNIYGSAWHVLQTWPDSFYSLLSQYVEKPMSSIGQAGLNKHFRDIHERLHRQQKNDGIARLKEEFDRYIEEYWPGVLEPKRITRIKFVSGSRNIISKKEASSLLGSRLERIDKLVIQRRITPIVFKGKAHYLRDQIEALANEISLNWTMVQACDALEITRFQLKQLLDAGLIPALQTPDTLNRDWVIGKQESQNLIAMLLSKASHPEPISDTASMAGMYRKGYSIVQLLKAMLDGEIEYVATTNVDKPTSLKQFYGFKHKV